MRNRGPDHQDFAAFSVGDRQVRLLHSRLSIIDLDPRSNQPFTIEDTTVVFNGEIYNYIELRQQLQDRGVELRTSSDTEVLLHFYRLYGKRCVDHFEGMWTFAIFDGKRGHVFLSRDRFGEKPLYYIKTDDGYYFGSEIKFLKELSGQPLAINRRHILRNLVHGYKSLYKTKETYFERVQSLNYAESATITRDGELNLERYWKPVCSIDSSMTIEDAIEGARRHLLNSVKIRLRSDVPLAFCLSGGIDSASLASIAAKEFNANLTTFSIIDSDDRYNEEDNILATVRDIDCDHHLIHVDQTDVLPRLRSLIEYHDGPVATISYYVHSLISKAVHDGGFRVTFSGTAADELFTGYYDHFLLHLNEVREHPDYQNWLQDWKEHILPLVRNPILQNPDLYKETPNYRDHIFDGLDAIRPYLTAEFQEPYREASYADPLLRNRMLNELFHESIPVILHEDDLNSMHQSIENRSPYLDTDLMNFAYSIPSEHLVRDGYAKYVLREAMKGTLNDQVRLDRTKKGFNASINSMIDFQNPETRDYLLDPSAEVFEFIDRQAVSELMDQFPIPNHFSKFLFNFVNTRIFLELS